MMPWLRSGFGLNWLSSPRCTHFCRPPLQNSFFNKPNFRGGCWGNYVFRWFASVKCVFSSKRMCVCMCVNLHIYIYICTHIHTSTTPTLLRIGHNTSLRIRSAGIDQHLDWKSPRHVWNRCTEASGKVHLSLWVHAQSVADSIFRQCITLLKVIMLFKNYQH